MQTAISEAEEQCSAELHQLALEYARRDQTEPLREMLQRGLYIDLTDRKGNTLLMLASCHGHVDTTRMLLQHGAAVDRRNRRGQTPLGAASFKGYPCIVSLLLKHGAHIDSDNGGGFTPIMFAAISGRSAVASQLKAQGASLDHRTCLGLSARTIFRVASFVTNLLPENSLPFERRRLNRW